MRCLVLADLHYALPQFDWLQSVAGRFDAAVIAGDLIDIGSRVEVDVQILVLLKYLRRIHPTTRLLVSSGNHDMDGVNADHERVATWLQEAKALGIPVDGDSLELEGMLFTICPWWDGPHTRAKVEALLERDAARGIHPWIWIYHEPPDQSPVSWTGKDFAGDHYLPGYIERHKPTLVLSGHVHQSPFRKEGAWVDKLGETWVFNAGRQIGPCPAHIILDTEVRTAEWHSQAGDEVVTLTGDPDPREMTDT